MAKHAAYFHPRTPTPRRYWPIERKEAAALIREHKRTKTLSVSTTTYGMRVYRFFTAPDFFRESGYVQMFRTTPARSAE